MSTGEDRGGELTPSKSLGLTWEGPVMKRPADNCLQQLLRGLGVNHTQWQALNLNSEGWEEERTCLISLKHN
jgi:hypothetical protein